MVDSIGGRRWYVGTVRAGGVALAELHLKRQPDSFEEVFSPSVSEERLEGRKKRRVVRELNMFPGYIFVAFDVEVHRWRSFNGTVGCGKLLGANADSMPFPLPVGFVEELQLLQGRGELTSVRADAVVHRYTKGQLVDARSGPWAGHGGSFSRYRKGSLLVWMTLFSKEVEVKFHPHELVPASPKAA